MTGVAGVLPNFLLVGAGKAGTTTLCELLTEHPAVFMPARREVNYFSNDEIYARGRDWYLSCFEGAAGCVAVGEGSGRYTSRDKYPKAAERIARDLPDVRILYIVRHPLRRLESLWMQKLSQGDSVPHDFSHYVRSAPADVSSCNYEYQIAPYRERFGDDRILVLFHEDLRSHPEKILAEGLGFLGVAPDERIRNPERQRNVSVGKKVDRPLVGALRRAPLFSRVKLLVPGAVRRRTRSWLSTRIEGRPEWAPGLREQLLDEMSDDLTRFLDRYGRPREMWDLG